MILTSNSFKIIRGLTGSLNQSQVNGLNFIVQACDDAGLTYPECAYTLATVYVECSGTFQPIIERGSVAYFDKYDTGKLANALGNTPEKDGDGYKYRGRGYVQLTGDRNYKLFTNILKVDLIGNPDLALEPEIAANIMTYGMLNGSFTGVGFRRKRPVGRYDRTAYVRARNIINGTDRAGEIADYAMLFERALRS